MAQLAGNAHWAEPSPLFAHKARPTPLKCKNEYLVLALGEETTVQSVIGCIVWAFRRLKKSRCREMGARGYALHSVRPPTFLPFPLNGAWKFLQLKRLSDLGPIYANAMVNCYFVDNRSRVDPSENQCSLKSFHQDSNFLRVEFDFITCLTQF